MAKRWQGDRCMWVSDREKHDAGCSTDVHHLLGLGIGKERVNSDTRHRGAGLVAGDKKPYEYLIQSIKDFYNQEQLLDLIKEAKFINNEYRNLTTGVAAIHSGWKKQ